MTHAQIEALRTVLAIADKQGITASWAPGTGLQMIFQDTPEYVETIVALEDLAPTYLDVTQFDHTDLDGETLPMVVVYLKPRVRQLVEEGALDE